MNRKQVERMTKRLTKKVEKVMKVKFKKVELSDTLQYSEIDTVKGHLVIGLPALEYEAKREKTSVERMLFYILVHEALHLRGFWHDYNGRKIGFYSHSIKDKFTPAVVKLMFGDNK